MRPGKPGLTEGGSRVLLYITACLYVCMFTCLFAGLLCLLAESSLVWGL